MTVSEVLKNSNIDISDSEVILADLLGKDRSFLFAHPEHDVPSNLLVKIAEGYKRRKNQEPLAYILGYKEFYGFKFYVNKNVLVPRPETEEIIDRVLSFMKKHPNQGLDICDVGTGSGCIAVTLAKRLPQAKIYALDKSKDALKVARENAKHHKIGSRITFLEGELLEPLTKKVDIIVANLPYVKSDKISDLESQISDWEPRIALDGGVDGMSHYNRFFSQVPKYLKRGGNIWYEINGKIYSNPGKFKKIS